MHQQHTADPPRHNIFPDTAVVPAKRALIADTAVGERDATVIMYPPIVVRFRLIGAQPQLLLLVEPRLMLEV